jgi:predicted metal-dependent hydrolase
MPCLLSLRVTVKVKIRIRERPYAKSLMLFQDFEYKIKYSHRRSISILVSPDTGVTVRAPFRTPVRTIEHFVNEKSAWIIKTLGSFSSLKRLDKQHGYSDGDSILLFGETFKLKIVPSDRYFIQLKDDKIIELEFRENNNPLLIRAIFENWLKLTAKKELTSRFQEALVKYSDYGFTPTEFTVRTMKKRWGSCSSKGKITISYDLLRIDKKFSEYVIVHELCHLKQHNHSGNYYKLLSEVYPDWKKVREELKKYLR